MHIPDGFLSPQTCAACYAAAAPFWYMAWRGLKKRFEATTAAHVGMAAAFVFLLQMINVPIPGGTSGHAVGAAMVAIALGPAPAIFAVSLALFLQAIIFGDGGLWAYGANVLTMAIVQSWVAWGVWRLAGGCSRGKRWMGAAAFASGYVAAIAGALVTGLLLGVQPIFFRDGAGVPLYFPLGLDVSLPAMLGSHLLVGVVEGGITLGAIRTLAAIPDFKMCEPVTGGVSRRVLAFALVGMVLIVPLGVVLPGMMNAGEPWGEWSPEETAEIAGHGAVPAGMERYAENYAAPVPDYQFAKSAGITDESAQYMGAAVLGVLLVGLICLPLHRLQQRRLARLRKRV